MEDDNPNKSGFLYDAQTGRLKKGIPDGVPIYECNDLCGCTENCPNRVCVVSASLYTCIAYLPLRRSCSADVSIPSRSRRRVTRAGVSLRMVAGSLKIRTSASTPESS